MKVKLLSKALKVAGKVGKGLAAHGPQIATGVGIALALVAGVRAVQKTPEALKLIEEKKEEEGKDELTVTETVKTTWKCYIWPVVMFVIAVIMIVGGQRVSTRRATAAAAACSLSQEMLEQYQKAAKEIVGDKKEEEIRALAAKNKVKEKPPLNTDFIVSTGKGNALCYDELSKRYFWSDPAVVRKAIDNLNWRLRDEMFISLSDYWSEIGLPVTDPGNLVCWRADDGQIDPDFESVVVQDGPYAGWPCLVISFYAGPKYDYSARC